MSALLSLSGVSKRFRGLVAVDGVSFDLPEGVIFAVIGPNGAGKTTLFSMIAGALKPDSGTITFAGAPIGGLTPDAVCRRGIARTFQLVRPFPALSVADNVIVGALLREHHVDAARERSLAVLRRLDDLPHFMKIGYQTVQRRGRIHRTGQEVARQKAHPRIAALGVRRNPDDSSQVTA